MTDITICSYHQITLVNSGSILDEFGNKSCVFYPKQEDVFGTATDPSCNSDRLILYSKGSQGSWM